MQWLISQMWILLGVAALLGLFLGLAIRGLLAGRRLRRVEAARNAARSSLEAKQAEFDRLAASLSAAPPEISEDKSEALNAAETQVAHLSGEVDRLQVALDDSDKKKAELQTALDEAQSKDSGIIGTATAAAVGGAAGLVLGQDGDDVETDADLDGLRDRNTWLEDRVKALEADLSATPASDDQSNEAVSDESDPSADDPASTATTTIAQDKLEWQANYLRQRVSALENALILRTAAPEAEVELSEDDTEQTAEALTPDVDVPAVAEPSISDEEVARLRWRNRYLEGRLAYYEERGDVGLATATLEAQPDLQDEKESSMVAAAGAATLAAAGAAVALTDDTNEEDAPADLVEDIPVEHDPVEEEAAVVTDETEEASEPSDPTPDADEQDVAIEAEPVADLETEPVQDREVEAESDANVEVEKAQPLPSEGMLAELETTPEDDTSEADDVSEEPAPIEPVQPETRVKPRDGGDDLTAIGGIGPRISEVLNEQGIWTYEQIAVWTPENAAWIEQHLSFQGRIGREKWIDQAKVLIASQESGE